MKFVYVTLASLILSAHAIPNAATPVVAVAAAAANITVAANATEGTHNLATTYLPDYKPVLHAICATGYPKIPYVNSTLDLNTCIANYNGGLACVTGGSFMNTCVLNIAVSSPVIPQRLPLKLPGVLLMMGTLIWMPPALPSAALPSCCRILTPIIASQITGAHSNADPSFGFVNVYRLLLTPRAPRLQY
ncbi:hypothetical protein M422DRAFT_43218 [Sphaerobolus stellatus SS14]|nr:hypothetical protein M422DRAFT_43218 [Sphaerobolus stellatus SS14]